MHDPEIQFPAPEAALLADAIRDALGEEGRKPSRQRVRAWIRAGRVRLDGRVVEDPGRILDGGETIDLGPGPEMAATGRPAASGAEGILHLDRHLLVVAYEPPVRVRPDGGEVETRLAQALEAAAVGDLTPRAVPAPDARVGGLVVAALSEVAEEALVRTFGDGTAALTVVADVVEGDGAPIRIREDAVPSVPEFLGRLERRGVRAQSGAGRPLQVHVAAVRLPHPRTGRALTWTLDLPPTFAPDPR